MSDIEDSGGCSVYNVTGMCQSEQKTDNHNICKWKFYIRSVFDMYVLYIIADGGSADGGGKGEAFNFHCINPHMSLPLLFTEFSLSFSAITLSHTQITRALSSLKHHLTCLASLGESSWCWCCKLGLFLPCGSSKRKTAPMKLCEQYSFINRIWAFLD